MPTLGEIEDSLASLSSSLPDAFQQTIERIQRLPESRSRLGIQSLMWICHSRQPISVAELSDALAVQPGQKELRPKYRPSARILLECCQGLVSVDEESDTVRLAHKAIQEFLLEYGLRLFGNPDIQIASICFTYLSLDPFRRLGPLTDSKSIQAQIDAAPLLPYASMYAAVHARQVQNDEDTQRLVLAFLSVSEAVGWANQVYQFSRGLRKEYWATDECKSITALHVACRFGLEIIVRRLLEMHNFSINVATKMGTTPLITAASGGHLSIVRLLLNNGADIFAQNWYGDALDCAAESGNCEVIRELVSWGMSPTVTSPFSRGPLSCTFDRDRAAAFLTLVELGAELFPRNQGTSPGELHYAVLSEATNIASVITEKKLVDIDTKAGAEGFTALHLAVKTNQIDMVEMLVNAGADSTMTDVKGRTAADIAYKLKAYDTVRMLTR